MQHTLELGDPNQHATQGKCSSGSAYACGGSWSSLHLSQRPGMDVGSARLQNKIERRRVHPVHSQLLHLSLAAAGGGRSQWLSQRRGSSVRVQQTSLSHTSGVLPGLSISQESLLHSSYVVYSTLHVFSCLLYMCFFTLKYIPGLLGM